jgi:hypothetical protein
MHVPNYQKDMVEMNSQMPQVNDEHVHKVAQV